MSHDPWADRSGVPPAGFVNPKPPEDANAVLVDAWGRATVPHVYAGMRFNNDPTRSWDQPDYAESADFAADQARVAAQKEQLAQLAAHYTSRIPPELREQAQQARASVEVLEQQISAAKNELRGLDGQIAAAGYDLDRITQLEGRRAALQRWLPLGEEALTEARAQYDAAINRCRMAAGKHFGKPDCPKRALRRRVIAIEQEIEQLKREAAALTLLECNIHGTVHQWLPPALPAPAPVIPPPAAEATARRGRLLARKKKKKAA